MPEIVDGRYELVSVIASGGMATVWRARDQRLDRDVALKRPHPTHPDDPRHDRMLREAKAAAAIGHPNLVTVLDAGEDENGLFMVMELVEGPTLDRVAAELSHEEILKIGASVGEALAMVHGSGIVHRDVKPSNILMSEQGPQLTDFGVAFNTDADRMTQPGTVLATPGYAAPEVLAGEPPTPQSDVYSLGVVVFELLTGAASNCRFFSFRRHR
jgi:eukaryotic-like serine/threonine-protein kinase